VSQKAMDMGFDGLMIETHIHPAQALSDAAQQITPDTLAALLSELVIRNNKNTASTQSLGLEYLRQQMDTIDAEIIDLIARRMDLSEKIGHLKKDCNMTAYQPERWREIVETRSMLGSKVGLSRGFIIELYEKIHHYSIARQ